MAYFIDLFSPETYEAFTRSTQCLSGFQLRHKGMAERIKPGDVFACYATKVSRWCGLLEIIEGPFIDSSPILLPENDLFVVRFKVRPKVWLPLDHSLPIHDTSIWDGLSFTRKLEKGSIAWTGRSEAASSSWTTRTASSLPNLSRRKPRRVALFVLREPARVGKPETSFASLRYRS